MTARTSSNTPVNNANDVADNIAKRVDPLQGMLLFHRSIRAALQAFDELVAAAQQGRCDEYRASALHDFFIGPMQRHDLDERESVLKRLARIDDAAFGAAVAASLHEHEALDRIVAEVIEHLAAIAARSAWPDIEMLRRAAADLRAVLEPHMEREERDVFPRARALFTADDLAAIQDEVAERQAAAKQERARRPSR